MLVHERYILLLYINVWLSFHVLNEYSTHYYAGCDLFFNAVVCDFGYRWYEIVWFLKHFFLLTHIESKQLKTRCFIRLFILNSEVVQVLIDLVPDILQKERFAVNFGDQFVLDLELTMEVNNVDVTFESHVFVNTMRMVTGWMFYDYEFSPMIEGYFNDRLQIGFITTKRDFRTFIRF